MEIRRLRIWVKFQKCWTLHTPHSNCKQSFIRPALPDSLITELSQHAVRSETFRAFAKMTQMTLLLYHQPKLSINGNCAMCVFGVSSARFAISFNISLGCFSWRTCWFCYCSSWTLSQDSGAEWAPSRLVPQFWDQRWVNKTATPGRVCMINFLQPASGSFGSN